MLNIGCHLSASKGFKHMGSEALKIGANTFQFFARNPRGGKAKVINEEDLAALRKIIEENKFAPIIAHAPYTVNACSANPAIRDFSKEMIAGDINTMEALPGSLYNFHPGNHLGQGVEVGVNYIANMLNEILKPEQSTTVLLETMSGKGSEIGRSFQELKQILDRVVLWDKIGVCIDTCHIFDGGYDIVNNLDWVLDDFDKIIGIQKLHAVHLNDSLNTLNSHKDRHAKIGEGLIGIEAIIGIINHPALKGLPFILETPNDLAGYENEIKLLKDAYKAQ